jgi:hypothetical protein
VDSTSSREILPQAIKNIKYKILELKITITNLISLNTLNNIGKTQRAIGLSKIATI